LGGAMKKFFENKPRAWFAIGSIVVLLLVISFLAVSYLFQDATEPGSEAEEPTVEIYSYTKDEIEEMAQTRSVSGNVTAATATSLKIAAAGKSYTFVITDNSVIEKGVSLTAASYQDLTVGKQVSVSFDSETDEVINIWFEK
jgi:uncharacterized protein YpmB